MHLNWIFEPLGIEATKDKSLIKKAYAQKVKECHPEEHPKEWQRLHQAYKDALRYASGQIMFYDEIEVGEEQCEELVEQAREIIDSPLCQESSPEEKEEDQKIFEDLVVKAVRYNDPHLSDVFQKLEKLNTLSAYSSYGAWIELFESTSIKECYDDKEILETLGKVLRDGKIHNTAAEYIIDVLEQFLKELEESGKENEASLIKAMQQGLQSKFHLLPPKEKESRRIEKERQKSKMFAGRKGFLIVCGIAFLGIIMLSFVLIEFFSLAFYLIIVTPGIFRAIFSIKDIVRWFRKNLKRND